MFASQATEGFFMSETAANTCSLIIVALVGYNIGFHLYQFPYIVIPLALSIGFFGATPLKNLLTAKK